MAATKCIPGSVFIVIRYQTGSVLIVIRDHENTAWCAFSNPERQKFRYSPLIAYLYMIYIHIYIFINNKKKLKAPSVKVIAFICETIALCVLPAVRNSSSIISAFCLLCNLLI